MRSPAEVMRAYTGERNIDLTIAPTRLCRFIELRPMDVLKFGLSTREFVLMNDQLVA